MFVVLVMVGDVVVGMVAGDGFHYDEEIDCLRLDGGPGKC